jgi:hypothetical protein
VGAYDPNNIFAKILRGEIPSVRVWEDEHVLAFMDVFPQSEGHVLVISKTSTARTLLEIEADALARLEQRLARQRGGDDAGGRRLQQHPPVLQHPGDLAHRLGVGHDDDVL